MTWFTTVNQKLIKHPWLALLAVYTLWRGWLWFITAQAAKILPLTTGYLARESYGASLPNFVWPWGNMDGSVFMLIAKNGYQASELPFFPLFPLFMRWTAVLMGIPLLLAGLLVSVLAFAGAMYFAYQLLKLEGKKELFGLFFILLISYPTGHYLTAVYNDALFLLWAMGTLYFGRQGKFVIASMFGALATLTRLNGLALALYLGFEYFVLLQPGWVTAQQWWNNRQQWRSVLVKGFNFKNWAGCYNLWLALLIPGAFVGYLAWIHLNYGDWQLFFKGVQVWHRDQLTFPLQTVWRYLKILVSVNPRSLVYGVAAAELTFTVFYWLVWLFNWNRIRLSYWLLMVFTLLIPMLTGTLQGMPRYGLHLFPLFYSLSLWMEPRPRWVKFTWIGVSLILQVVYVGLFTRGYFVA